MDDETRAQEGDNEHAAAEKRGELYEPLEGLLMEHGLHEVMTTLAVIAGDHHDKASADVLYDAAAIVAYGQLLGRSPTLKAKE